MKIRTIQFEKKRGKKLYEQVFEKIQHDILEGYLKQGDQLPSIRQAENLFNVSRTCILQAYEALLMNGMVHAIPQKGYFVDVDEEHIRLRKHVMDQVHDIKEEVIRFDFRSQSMDKEAFDITLWKKYLKEVLDHHTEISTYGVAKGEKALQVALANYSYSMRGVLCDETKILVGASIQSLLYSLFGLIGRPCVFAMEEDSFLPAQMVCQDYQIPIHFLKRQQEGICIEELEKHHVNVLYVNTLASGLHKQPLTKKQQKELLVWAKRNHAYIIEDDHNGELRYHTRMMSAMHSLDGGEHVVYAGSFSRLLLPSFRISYLVLNDALNHIYTTRQEYYTPTSSKIEQLALAHYISDGHLERHVKRLRKQYALKANHMYALLKHYFPNTTMYLEESSLCFVLTFEEGVNINQWLYEASKFQIRIHPSEKNTIRLSFAAIDEDIMDEAIKEIHTLYTTFIKQ